MKKNTHPEYHKIKVLMTDGTEFETRSSWGKEGAVLKLDVDPTTHPAWSGGGAFINENISKIAKFKEKFGSVFSLDED